MIPEEACKFLVSTLNLSKGNLGVWIHRAQKAQPVICLALNPAMDEQVKSMIEPKIPKTIGGYEVRREQWSTPIDLDAETANKLFEQVNGSTT